LQLAPRSLKEPDGGLRGHRAGAGANFNATHLARPPPTVRNFPKIFRRFALRAARESLLFVGTLRLFGSRAIAERSKR
jgi:hypothetical protein